MDAREGAVATGIGTPLLVAAAGVEKRLAGDSAGRVGVAVGEAPTIHSLLEENNALLRRAVVALEILIGQSVADPQ